MRRCGQGPHLWGVVNEGEGEKRVINENDDEMFFLVEVYFIDLPL